MYTANNFLFFSIGGTKAFVTLSRLYIAILTKFRHIYNITIQQILLPTRGCRCAGTMTGDTMTHTYEIGPDVSYSV